VSDAKQHVIHVVVADDHPIVRSGICSELARHSDIRVVGEAVNGDESLALAMNLRPDVLLLDINMPGLQAVKVVRLLRGQLPMIHVVVLSAYGDEEHVIALLSAGAGGYVLKDEKPAIIVDAIRAAMRGTLWLSPRVAQAVSHAVERAVEDAPEKTLTPRELEVLRMMARGMDNQKIAESLSVTEATVKFHVGHIYDKLGVKSRIEAVLYAMRRALVDVNADQTS
jgi:DNA-binding NarL/FixJ family response regulator